MIPIGTMTKAIFEAQFSVRSILADMIRNTRVYSPDLSQVEDARERLRGEMAAEAELICWGSPAFFKAIEMFQATEWAYDVDSSWFKNQIHFFENPMHLDADSLTRIQKRHPYDLTAVRVLGFINLFFMDKEVLMFEQSYVMCRDFTTWDRVKESDLVCVYDYHAVNGNDLPDEALTYLAMNGFLRSKVAVSENRTSNAKTKKRTTKKKRPQTMRVIVLRKSEGAQQEVKAGEDSFIDGDGRKITCKFNVEGHWRNQWYPSEGIHRRIRVDSFVKGEGLPKKEKIPTVIKAAR